MIKGYPKTQFHCNNDHSYKSYKMQKNASFKSLDGIGFMWSLSIKDMVSDGFEYLYVDLSWPSHYVQVSQKVAQVAKCFIIALKYGCTIK